MEPASRHHRPVLCEEVLEVLDPRAGEVHADLTIGPGGHAEAILARLGPRGLLIGIDRDPESLVLARERLGRLGYPFRLFHGIYTELQRFIEQAGIPLEGALDGVLLDLGVSSLQLDRPGRGFSFQREGPLDMRMDPSGGDSAADFLRSVSADELRRVLREYGEEPASARIARAIVAARDRAPIVTTGQLARIVEEVSPRRGRKTHPATRTFQAIRIAVNRELECLRLVLRDLDRLVRPGGRVVVLGYHSLEDRIVKEAFRERVREGIYRALTRGAAVPRPEEIAENPRARSARLRGVERSGGLR